MNCLARHDDQHVPLDNIRLQCRHTWKHRLNAGANEESRETEDSKHEL